MGPVLAVPDARKVTGGSQLPATRLLAPCDVETLHEQGFDVFRCRIAACTDQSCLDAQHFSDGPSLTGLVRDGGGLFDDLQRGIVVACLCIGLGPDRQEDRQP